MTIKQDNVDIVQQNIESPCVRNCCLNEQDICMGCFRHIDEIVGWQRRTPAEKALIIESCNQRRKT